MNKFTVHLINEQYYKFIGEAKSANDKLMSFRLQDGSKMVFNTQHITLVEEREVEAK